jgi:hypothetical protein
MQFPEPQFEYTRIIAQYNMTFIVTAFRELKEEEIMRAIADYYGSEKVRKNKKFRRNVTVTLPLLLGL